MVEVAEGEPVADKRRKGPREEVTPVQALSMLLDAWAVVIRKDEGFQSILASVPRTVRRELAREFANRVVALR